MDWVRDNVRRLHRLLKNRGWSRLDAEDLIQDAFLKMQTYCDQGGEVRDSEAFLVRTVMNLSANARSRHRMTVYVEDIDRDPALLLGEASAPDEELAAEQGLNRVIALVDALTPRARQVFLLHYVHDYSYPQIAQQLGISVSAIEKHIARAMLAITREFER